MKVLEMPLIYFILLFSGAYYYHQIKCEVNAMKSTMKNAVTPKPEHPGEDPYGCDRPHAMENSTCSATDFTGLIPAGMPDDEELEAYAEMYHYPGDIKNIK
jgi:hypothetical protein